MHIICSFLQHSLSNLYHIIICTTQGHAEFWLTLLYESLDDSKLFFFGSVGIMVVWSVLCAFFSEWLHNTADDGSVRAQKWLVDIDNCTSAIRTLGTLFVFTLVFRFQTCYDRWWEARKYWGDMISRSLEMNMLNIRWINNGVLNDRISRYIIAYCYASMALLRGTSLAADDGRGKELVERGVLVQDELNYLEEYPFWQPHFFVELIRAVIVEAYKLPNGIVVEEDHKIYGQFLRAFEAPIKDMTDLIGDSIRTRSSGLPASYDAITMMSYYLFFFLAAFVWSVSIGWMVPIIIGCASFVVMFLIVMGSKLVDPFGFDKVDIPLEAFCETVEAQVCAQDVRARSKIIEKFATSSSDTRTRSSLNKSITKATSNIPNLA